MTRFGANLLIQNLRFVLEHPCFDRNDGNLTFNLQKQYRINIVSLPKLEVYTCNESSKTLNDSESFKLCSTIFLKSLDGRTQPLYSTYAVFRYIMKVSTSITQEEGTSTAFQAFSLDP